jgi:hypothetical protein
VTLDKADRRALHLAAPEINSDAGEPKTPLWVVYISSKNWSNLGYPTSLTILGEFSFMYFGFTLGNLYKIA